MTLDRPNFTMPRLRVRRPAPLPTREPDVVAFVSGEVTAKGEMKGSCLDSRHRPGHSRVKLRHRNHAEQAEWVAQIGKALDKVWPRDAELHNGPVMIWCGLTRIAPQRHAWYHPLWCTKPDGDKMERCIWDAGTGRVWTEDSRVTRWAGEKLEADPGETAGAHIRIWLITPDDLPDVLPEEDA